MSGCAVRESLVVGNEASAPPGRVVGDVAPRPDFPARKNDPDEKQPATAGRASENATENPSENSPAAELALAYLSQKLFAVDDLALELAFPTQKTRNSKGDDEYFVVGLYPLEPARRIRVDVEVRSRGLRRALIPVWFKARGRVDAWVAAKKLEQGEIMTAEKYRRESALLQNIACKRPDMEAPLVRQASRAIAAGTILCEGDFEAAPDIAAHQRVKLRMVINGRPVDVSAIAAKPGRVGQSITVKIISTGAIVSGKVVDAEYVAYERSL